MNIFVIIIAGVVFILGAIVYFVKREKYMRWYYRQFGKEYQNYDANKFRLSHAGSLILFSVLCLLLGFKGHSDILLILMILTVALNFILVLIWCKKKDK